MSTDAPFTDAPFNFPRNGKEREDKLLAAKKKMKSYRAKQNALSSSLSNPSVIAPSAVSTPSPTLSVSALSISRNVFGESGSVESTPFGSVAELSSSNTSLNNFDDLLPFDAGNLNGIPKQPSFSTPSFSKHQHKRSISIVKAPPPLKLDDTSRNSSITSIQQPFPSPQFQTHGKKPSHSRNKSKGGHSHKRSKSSKDFKKFTFGGNSSTPNNKNHFNRSITPENTLRPLPASQLFSSPNPSPFLQPNSSSSTNTKASDGRSFPSGPSPNTWVFPRKNVQSQPPPPRTDGFLSVSNVTSGQSSPMGSDNDPRTPGGHTHSKTRSRHNRRSSVTTRAASLSLMGGIPFSNGPSNSVTPQITPIPTPSSPQDLEVQRRQALSKLEGRLREKREEIDLEGASERSLSPSPGFLLPPSPAKNGGSNPTSPAFRSSSPKAFPNLHSNKRNSWSGVTSVSGGFSNPSSGGIGLGVGMSQSFTNETVASMGGKGAHELGMLVEEEEEGEDNGEETESPVRAFETLSITETKSQPTTISPQPQRRFPVQRSYSNATSSHESFGSSGSGRSRSSFDDNGDLRGGKNGLRSLRLSISSSADISGLNSPLKSGSDRKRNSLYTVPSSALPSPLGSKPSTPGGFRSLSMSFPKSSRSPSLDNNPPSPAWVNPNGRSRSRLSSLSSIGGRRSSISYKKDPSTNNLPTTTPMSTSASGNYFLGGPGDGGFGDLELAESESESLTGLPFQQGGNQNSFRNTNEEITFLRSHLEKVKAESAAELNAIKSETNRVLKESRFRFLELERQSKEEEEVLRNKISQLEVNLERAKAAMEEGTAAKVSEVEKLRNDLEELKIKTEDIEMERDELKEDVEGWRIRVKNLEKSLAMEKTVLEEEKKENALAREKIRKLGDRLQSATNDTKLTGELKEQVFNLVATLEKERKESESMKLSLEAQMKKEKTGHEEVMKSLLAQLEAEKKKRRNTSDGTDAPVEVGDESESGNESSSAPSTRPGSVFSTISTNSSMSSFGPIFSSQKSSFGFSSYPGDSQYDMPPSSDDETPKYPAPIESTYNGSEFVFKTGLSDFNAGVASFGGLQTLAEEDEDEDELARMEEAASPLPHSTSFQPLPITLTDEQNLAVPLEFEEDTKLESDPIPIPIHAPVPQQPLHHKRVESFVKQWSFPKGPVAKTFTQEETHSFFGLNPDNPSLPPLPVSDAAMNLPFALMAGLAIEESLATPSHIRRPSSPRPIYSPITPRYFNSLYGATPPPARSAHVARASGSSQDSGSFSLASSAGSSLKRLSLQSFANLFGSYANLSPTATSLAVGASRLCSTGDDDATSPRDSLTYEVTRPLITKKKSTAPQTPSSLNPTRSSLRFINPNQQPMPVPSSYAVLDFTSSCPCDSDRLIMV